MRSAVVGLAAVALVLLALPLVALVVRTVEGVGGRDVLLMRPVASALALSLGTTSLSMVIVIILGTPLAYIFARYRFRFKQVLNTLIELPIVMPPVVAGLALLMAFGRRGLLGSSLELLGITLPFTPMAVVLAQVFVSAPFFIRTAQVRFQAIPREVEEAANIDGAGGWQTFWHVTLPLSLRGMLAGLLLSWARALGEFGATILFAGSLQGRTQTMPLLVYSALERDINAALWTGLLLVGMAAAALWLMRWLARAWDDGDDPLVEI